MLHPNTKSWKPALLNTCFLAEVIVQLALNCYQTVDSAANLLPVHVKLVLTQGLVVTNVCYFQEATKTSG